MFNDFIRRLLGQAPTRNQDILGDRTKQAIGKTGVVTAPGDPNAAKKLHDAQIGAIVRQRGNRIQGDAGGTNDLISGFSGTGAYAGDAGDGTDYALMSKLRGEIGGKVNNLRGIYEALFGEVDKYIGSKRNELDTQYGEQFGELDKAYQKTNEQLPMAYGARGLQDSSYLTNAVVGAKDTYETNQKAIEQDRQQKYAGLGEFGATTKAQLGSGKGQLEKYGDLSNYTVADLQIIRDDIDAAIANAEQQRAGLGTTEEFAGKLNEFAPAVNKGTEALAKQLQTIVQSSLPKIAKDALAQGLLKRNQLSDPTAQSYWTNYYQSLLMGKEPQQQ